MAAPLAPPPPAAAQRFVPDPDTDDDADVDDVSVGGRVCVFYSVCEGAEAGRGRVAAGFFRPTMPMPLSRPTHPPPPPQHRLPKEYTAYLVDASPLARTPCGVKGVDGVSPSDTWLTVALRVVRGVLASQILTSPSDEAAVFLVGGPLPGGEAKTKVAATGGEAGDGGDMVGVQAMAPPCARGVVKIGALADEASMSIDAKAPASSSHPEAWQRALRAVTRVLGEKTKKGGKGSARRCATRLTIITPDDGTSPATSLPPDGPARGRTVDMTASAAEAGAVVDVLALVGGGGTFDSTPASFWGAVLAGASAGRAKAAAARGRSPAPSSSDDDDDDDPDGGVDAPRDGVALFRSVAGAVRARGYRRTPLTTLPLFMPGGARAAVAVYQVTQTAKPGGTVPVSARSHVAVGVVRGGEGGGGGGHATTASPPPSIAAYRLKPVSKSATLAVSIPPPAKAALGGAWGLAGFTFLGTAPVESVAPPHLAAVRTPTFLYPAERRLPGSTALVAALRTALMEEGAAVVASFVRRSGAAPSLVAVLPPH